MAALVAVAAAGYWSLNRPPRDWKRDNSGLYPIKIDGKFGFMDRSGKTVISPQFDATDGFSEGLASVRIGTKAGYINTKGTLVITPQFDSGGLFTNGRATVRLASGSGAIDTDGKLIGSPTFQWVGAFSGAGDLAPVGTPDNHAAFIDRSGSLLWPGRFDAALSFTAGLAPAAAGMKWGYIDAKGSWVIDPQFEFATNFREGTAPVKVGGKWGYIDSKGKFVINPQFAEADSFSEDRAAVQTEGACFYIDTKGSMMGDAKFSGCQTFTEGLAAVHTNDGWAYIDRMGKMIISPQFENAGMFQNGLAWVMVAGKEAYVTKTGEFVVDPLPKRAGNGAVTGKWAGSFADGGGGLVWEASESGKQVSGPIEVLNDMGQTAGHGNLAGQLHGGSLEFTISWGDAACGTSGKGVARIKTQVIEGTYTGTTTGSACGGASTSGRFSLKRTLPDSDSSASRRPVDPAMAAAERLVRANPDLDLVSEDDKAQTLTIRDKKSGETITVSPDDVNQGRFKFEAIPIDANTVALYHFEDPPGNVVADATGVNPGVATGTTIVPSLFGHGRQFRGNGDGDYITVPDNPSLRGMPQMTIEAWVCPTGFDLGANNANETIVGRGDQAPPYNLYQITMTRNNDPASSFDYFTVAMQTLASGQGSSAQSTIHHLPNQWYYIVGTYDGQKARVYVNGVLEQVGNTFPGLLVNTTDPLYFDNHTFFGRTASSNGRIGGVFDEIRIFHIARSASEIAAIYAAAPHTGPH